MSGVRGPLKWHGGKSYLARKIVACMPRHLNYCEPYFGGGSVLLARDPDDLKLWVSGHKGVSEVVNDIHRDLTNFWQVLQNADTFHAFQRIIQATPFSEIEFSVAQKARIFGDDVDRAVNFFVLCRQSLAGRMKSFTGITKTRLRRGMNNEVSAWLSTIEGLSAVHERLKRVLVLNKYALKVIKDMDGPETLFYLDPPYVKGSRTAPDVYHHEMSDDAHQELIALLHELEAKVMLSGYHHPIYDVLHKRYGWRLKEFDLPNNSAGGNRKDRRLECLWTNYERE